MSSKPPPENPPMKLALTILLAAIAIAAFAGNSLIARAALADGAIEAGAYSVIRLASGALVLLPVLGARPSLSDLPGAASLAIYVGGFSLAYLQLGAGLGGIILFTCVQATIIAVGLLRGERLGWVGGIGVALAIAGMVWVIGPQSGREAMAMEELFAVVSMAVAGMAWGAYTLIGRGSANAAGGATGSTARSFLIASVMVAPMLAWDSAWPTWDGPYWHGAALAVLSGVVTSGLGYVVWYKVAPQLGLGTVASVQLATPVAAALGGAAFLAEPLTAKIALGGGLILAGIALTVFKPARN